MHRALLHINYLQKASWGFIETMTKAWSAYLWTEFRACDPGHYNYNLDIGRTRIKEAKYFATVLVSAHCLVFLNHNCRDGTWATAHGSRCSNRRNTQFSRENLAGARYRWLQKPPNTAASSRLNPAQNNKVRWLAWGQLANGCPNAPTALGAFWVCILTFGTHL